MTEEQIQEHVVQLLRAYAAPDVVWFAVPNGGARTRKVGGKLKAQGVRRGAPDLVFLIQGWFHGVELKTATGASSPHQKAFGEAIEKAGGRYRVCHGLDATIQHLSAIGAFRPGIRFRFSTSRSSNP